MAALACLTASEKKLFVSLVVLVLILLNLFLMGAGSAGHEFYTQYPIMTK